MEPITGAENGSVESDLCVVGTGIGEGVGPLREPVV